MNQAKIVLWSVAGLAAFLLFTFLALHWAGFLGVQSEKIRTDILKESQAFKDGKRNELNRLYLEFQKADSVGRIGIANATRDMFAAVDTAGYPAHLQQFLTETGTK